MPIIYKSILARSLVMIALSAGIIASSPAQTLPAKVPAVAHGFRVVDAFGTVDKRMAGGSYVAVGPTAPLSSQTTIRTGEDSAVLLALPGNSYIRIGAKSVVLLNPSGQSNGYSCRVLSGQVWVIVSAKSGRTVEINTPSATARTNAGLFHVGYDLESDTSSVSVGDGSVMVQLPSGSWQGTATTGQYVHYLRKPQPNIRLRAPEITSQTPEQQTIWKLLRTENWTLPNLLPSVPARMLRGNESKLRVLLQTPQVIGGTR